jgi:hypothetical protein
MKLNTFKEQHIQTVWSSLMLRLCSQHRINARNVPQPIKIEDLRIDQFTGSLTTGELICLCC